MKNLAVLLFLIYTGVAKGQTKIPNSTFVSIDHIPIVVENLDSVKKILAEFLHFKVKEGREHEGIKNCFVKFQDGTYLEFTTPVDSSQTIGKYYTDFLKTRQGGTSLAISVKGSDAIINFLNANSIPFETDSNKIWKTVAPKGADLFFIDYSDKSWKDTQINTTHFNTTLSLKSAYILSDDIELSAKKYESFGFSVLKDGTFLDIPCKVLEIGQSNLYLLDASKAKRMSSRFKASGLYGICGFEIKVRSLTALSKMVSKPENALIGMGKIIYFFSDNNFFLEFTE